MPKIQANIDDRLERRVQSSLQGSFREKLPGMVEHCMRLVLERLQHGLSKDESTDLKNPDTWTITPHEIEALSQALSTLIATHKTLER